MVHLNIRSVKNKLDELCVLINTLKPTVLTLSETWLTPGVESSLLKLEGYDLHRSDRRTSIVDGVIKTGGGLITYTHSSCIVDPLKYIGLCRSDGDIESQISVVNKGCDKGAVIVNLYRPPRGSVSVFLDYITQVLDVVSRERYRDVVLLGDLNLDHTYRNQNENVRKLQTLMNLHGFSQIIKAPTRCTIRTATIIDVIYIRTIKKVSPFMITTLISDHFLVGCTRYYDYTPDPVTSFYGRTYKNYSFEAAEAFYASADCSSIYQLTDVDMVWKTLQELILKCANHLCPYRKTTVKLNTPQWINSYILELIADRDRKFLEAYAKKSPDILAEARTLRTDARRAIRTARAEFINSQL